MSPRLLAFLVTASAVAAGCLEPGSGSITGASAEGKAAALAADWWASAIPFGDGHDHADRAHHRNLSTPNFHVLGWDPLTSTALGSTATGMGCGGVGETAEGRRIAVVHSFDTDVAFIVADVTDPAAPVFLGEYLLPNIKVWDATVTPDGLHALVAADPYALDGPVPTLPGAREAPTADAVLAALESPPAAPTFAVRPMFRDFCSGETRAAGPEQYVPYAPSLIMVGLSDPSAPNLEFVVPQPVIGPHSVTSAEVDGVIYATSSVTNLVHEASYYSFFEVSGSRLVPLSVIQAPGLETAKLSINGHVDVEVHKHPATGQVLAYLANWDGGMAIFDMSNPRVPVQLSTWEDEEDLGAIHEILPFDVMWGDRHYSLAGQEVGEPADLPSGWVYVVDTTDPANPVEVGRWTLPMKPDWDGGLQFSTHYVEVVNRTMFVTNYHGGMWAVDLSDPADPRAVGLFVPENEPATPHASCPCGPGVEDVVASPEGWLTVWDGAGGIYSLHYDESDPAPRAPAWPR